MTKSSKKNQNNSSLAELFKQVVKNNPDQSIIFIPNSDETFVQSYKDLLTSAEKIFAGFKKTGLSPQDKVILLLSNHQELLATFWGCLIGGFVPLIIETPLNKQNFQQTINKLTQIWELLEHPLIITDSNFTGNFPVINIAELIINKPEKSYYQAQPDDVAFLTLTSGSTGIPKCIQLTNKNIISRAEGTNLLNTHNNTNIILNWLAFDHIGSISDWHIRPLLVSSKLIYVQKEYILGNPLNWLNLIDKYRVTHSWSPNFVYNLINHELSKKHQQNWDLSCVNFLLTAGETINATNIQVFIEQLKPYKLINSAIRPAFGMAELASGITYYQPTDNFPLKFHCINKNSLQGKIKYTKSDNQEHIIFTDLGQPIYGVEMRIVNDNGEILEEETIGHLQVKGDVVFAGYYKNSLANQEVFTEDGWFKTGDLGFISQKNLVITGRAKDTIIINGINYYSQEIEAIVEKIDSVEPSYTAACAVILDTQEKLAIFISHSLETKEKLAKLLKQIRHTVISKLGVNPDYLIPVEKQVISKTEIGKIKRKLLSERFSLGEFNPIIAEVNRLLHSQKPSLGKSKLKDIITVIWQNVLSLDTINLKDNFFDLGGNSMLLLQLQAQLEEEFNQKISVSVLFQYPTIEAQTNYLQPNKINQIKVNQVVKQSKNKYNGAIAVIGMSCRFPGADNIEKFWQNLTNGIESITFFSDEELLASGIDPTLINNPNYVKARPILKDIDLFDADFFGYTPKEAELLDPQQRLLLECAWESLEDAGYNPFIYQGKIGLFAGAVMNTYLLNNVYPNRHKLDINDSLEVITLDSMGGFQMMVSNDKDYLTTRISYKLNLTGPSINVQTACSTSLVAIHLAKQSLLAGECDMALAGGVSLQIPQQVGYLYQEGMIVSPDGHCRAFDQSAQGTVFGNGVGLVVLKKLESAIADKDNIYAVIKGSAVNNDGGTKVGYFAPNGAGQSRAVAEAIANAGISANTIGYVETHGTGTVLGDPIEISGLSQGYQVTEKQCCPVGSVKTNVGHLQIASGVAGFIKAVLCLHQQKIPPYFTF